MSALYLNREVRSVLTSEYVKFDLKSAQVAVNSKFFELTDVQEFVKSTPSVWLEFCRVAGVPGTDEVKGGIKRALYAATNGAGVGKTGQRLQEVMSYQSARKLAYHPVFRSLMKGQRLKSKQLIGAGSITDQVGQVFHISEWETKKEVRKQATSILSCVENSYEMALLLPAIEYANSTESSSDPCYILFWLHDGFSMWCSPESRAWHVRNILAAIRKRSVELLGFEIGVEVNLPVTADLELGASKLSIAA